MPFSVQNGSFVLNKICLVQTIIIIFIYLLNLFIVQNLKNILTADPELRRCAIFGFKMVHLPQKNFFWKIIDIILIYLLAPFIAQTFKKTLPADPELWECAILGRKMALFPKWEFFRKPELCLTHLCLPTCQKSKSDIYLLVKYWQLKNTEISLAKSLFWL